LRALARDGRAAPMPRRGTGLAIRRRMRISDIRRDLRAARERVRAGAIVIDTSRGPVEYAVSGDGLPVLVLHGTSGGWDQGLLAARGLIAHGFRLIAPSRFGYLRTPLPGDASPEAEADTWAALLDALQLARVPVIAFSAGAAPAAQLALRHPDRVSSLILVVPGAGGLRAEHTPGPPRALIDALYRSDLPMWLVTHLAPRIARWLAAVPERLVPSLAPADRAQLDEMIATFEPVSARRLGTLNDGHTQETAAPYPLEQLTTPTLLVSAEDDLYRTLPVAREAAERIPGARLIAFPTGGHLLLGHEAELGAAVADFIRASDRRRAHPPS
jgi:pimeloyl-ACP methyl ester carboxylesterase